MARTVVGGGRRKSRGSAVDADLIICRRSHGRRLPRRPEDAGRPRAVGGAGPPAPRPHEDTPSPTSTPRSRRLKERARDRRRPRRRSDRADRDARSSGAASCASACRSNTPASPPATARKAVDEVFGEIDDDALLEAALDPAPAAAANAIADDKEFQRLYRYLLRPGIRADRVMSACCRARREEVTRYSSRFSTFHVPVRRYE